MSTMETAGFSPARNHEVLTIDLDLMASIQEPNVEVSEVMPQPPTKKELKDNPDLIEPETPAQKAEGMWEHLIRFQEGDIDFFHAYFYAGKDCDSAKLHLLINKEFEDIAGLEKITEEEAFSNRPKVVWRRGLTRLERNVQVYSNKAVGIFYQGYRVPPIET